jgi:hypothetical protein
MSVSRFIFLAAKVSGAVYQILLTGVMGYYLIKEVRRDARDDDR